MEVTYEISTDCYLRTQLVKWRRKRRRRWKRGRKNMELVEVLEEEYEESNWHVGEWELEDE